MDADRIRELIKRPMSNSDFFRELRDAIIDIDSESSAVFTIDCKYNDIPKMPNEGITINLEQRSFYDRLQSTKEKAAQRGGLALGHTGAGIQGD